MAKFDINQDKLGKATNAAALKHNAADEEMTIATIRSIPKSWGKKIKQATGNTLSSYARMAIRRQMQADGIID